MSSRKNIFVSQIALLFSKVKEYLLTITKQTTVTDTLILEHQKEVVNQVLLSIRLGNTQQAIIYFSKLNLDVSKKIEVKYYDLARQKNLGLISFENWLLEENKLNFSIYDLLPIIWVEKEEIPKYEITKLIQSGNIEKAIQIFLNLSVQEIVIVAGTMEKIKAAKDNYLITENTYHLMEARIKDSILGMLDTLN